jgi:hypothetical protein
MSVNTNTSTSTAGNTPERIEQLSFEQVSAYEMAGFIL